VSGQHHTPAAYYREKTLVLSKYEIDWAPEMVWTIWEKKLLTLVGIGTPDCPAHSLVLNP